ncbi:acetyltransferase [Mammaliicoccus sciuri]|uniref:acetyltransferase n=1 Tax=Mammaliicoccus sciuri TaxID=1296 RepID=UPI00208E0E05|nr:acetyltransferase [Mammaliicoccus sciuri]MCO4323960.1 acetyltransferase [Mammaliicoccus sciuri]
MKAIIMIGNGGHAKVIKDIIDSSTEYELKGYLDDNISERYVEEGILYDNLGNIENYKEDFYFNIAIGGNDIRASLFERIALPLSKFPVLIHPSAIISPSAKIGYGTVIMPKSVINSNSLIGSHVIINTSSIIEHDNVIDDYVHISPNATLTGGVKVGKKSQVGASATIIPMVSIGKNTIVGAGSTVVKNIGDNQIVVGTPAKPIRSDK